MVFRHVYCRSCFLALTAQVIFIYYKLHMLAMVLIFCACVCVCNNIRSWRCEFNMIHVKGPIRGEEINKQKITCTTLKFNTRFAYIENCWLITLNKSTSMASYCISHIWLLKMIFVFLFYCSTMYRVLVALDLLLVH